MKQEEFCGLIVAVLMLCLIANVLYDFKHCNGRGKYWTHCKEKSL